ncbi:perforin-1-like [Ambystoma mexicanum]|uniref:perforin-1-like n=1 Tax=Ambystoma mexicanum TaxID=8296 RepID=UPI0037E7E142
MAARFLPAVLLTSCCLLTYHLPVVQPDCTTGTYQQCLEADFIPGHDLTGTGFDVTTLRRTAGRITPLDNALSSAKTCTLCPNRLLNGRAQKLPHGIAEWRSYPTCALRVSNELFKSAASYAEWLSAEVGSDWRSGLGDVLPASNPDEMVLAAGSRAPLVQFTMKKEYNGGYVFATREVACVYYRLEVAECPTPETYFSDWLKLLPPVYSNSSKPLFYSLIGKYGTHYIRKAELGGRVREVTSLKSCELARDGISGDDVKDCLGVEAFASISSDLASKTDHCRVLGASKLSNWTFSHKYSKRAIEITGGNPEVAPTFSDTEKGQTYQKWAGSLHKAPDVVSYTLAPLHELVSFAGPTKQNLKHAIMDYITERAVHIDCPMCPEGALPRQVGGCSCQCVPSLELTEDCCPSQPGLAAISVMVERGNSLHGDTVTQTDGYVRVTFGMKQKQTSVIDNDDNPQWDQELDFGALRLAPNKLLTIEVWDEDGLFGNDLLGSCELETTPSPGAKQHTCSLTEGHITFKVKIQCLPNLYGPFCEIYQSTA